jgi:hypothetical protein
MNFPVHEKKTTQAVARVIQKSGGPVDYLRVSKLIYLADRASIEKRRIPIVGGHYFSMQKGPAISEFMSFVGTQSAPGWRRMISRRFGNEIRLEGVPEFGALSDSELAILDETVARHAKRTTEELVAWCHDNCAEYEEVEAGNRKPITVEAILRAVGEKASAIRKVVKEAEAAEELDKLLA